MIDIQKDSARRILVTALNECRRQDTDFRAVVDLLAAYEVAEFNSDNKISEVLIWRLAELIDPVYNARGYRQTPVTFANGGGSTSPQNIHRAMTTLISNVPGADGGIFTTDDVNEWIKQFLWIHPFRDGNGRCAWILYNRLKGTLAYPLPLPNFQF